MEIYDSIRENNMPMLKKKLLTQIRKQNSMETVLVLLIALEIATKYKRNEMFNLINYVYKTEWTQNKLVYDLHENMYKKRMPSQTTTVIPKKGLKYKGKKSNV